MNPTFRADAFLLDWGIPDDADHGSGLMPITIPG
jgi:hypothetical protein